VRPARLELATSCFVGKRSIQLSYGREGHRERSDPEHYTIAESTGYRKPNQIVRVSVLRGCRALRPAGDGEFQRHHARDLFREARVRGRSPAVHRTVKLTRLVASSHADRFCLLLAARLIDGLPNNGSRRRLHFIIAFREASARRDSRAVAPRPAPSAR
jgi:hypothetical protein